MQKLLDRVLQTDEASAYSEIIQHIETHALALAERRHVAGKTAMVESEGKETRQELKTFLEQAIRGSSLHMCVRVSLYLCFHS